MQVKASDIKAKLPEGGKKNCEECGFPTCFAFALELTREVTLLETCPHIAPQEKEELLNMLSPPMKLITMGVADNLINIGDEISMFRHDQAFRHYPAMALLISDKELDTEIDYKLKQINELQFERAGETLKANLLALKFDSKDIKRFKELVTRAYTGSKVSALLIAEDLEALFWARDMYAERRPLVYPITEKNIEAAIPRIRENPTPVGVKAESVENLIPLTKKLNESGIDELMLDPSPQNIFDGITDHTLIRKSAILSRIRPLGYPSMAFPCLLTDDPRKEMVFASIFVAKYAGLVVLSHLEEDHLFPLLLLRQDLYTDPKAMREVPAKIYGINQPNEDSPVLVTTNSALTYFMVSSEIEQSGVPTYLMVIDTGGFSVQTALGSDKFGGKKLADFLKRSGLVDKNNFKKLIIPRPAYVIKEELEIELKGWEIIVGPEKAKEIQPLLRQMQQSS
jgi:acetyl-CoA decarbonylase/synthase complex subunit gamma